MWIAATGARRFEALPEFFGKADLKAAGAVHAKTGETGHGRHEVREAWSVDAKQIDVYRSRWFTLRSITMVERTRATGDKRTVERHFRLSSLAPRVRRLADAASEHRLIENDLHC